jgi:hypothetical protein
VLYVSPWTAKMSTTFERYGLLWPKETDPLQIELYCIREGVGSQFDHYEAARKILWPNLDSHRWHTLCLREICQSAVTVLIGPGSSGKTNEAASYGLIRYFSDPDNTCVLVSSTDMRGLKLRIWGEITKLWQEARELHPWLAGNLIESRVAICTDEVGDDDASTSRDMRRGIIGIPTIQGGKQVGLGKWCFPPGTKVDTPLGKRSIEDLRIGDWVWNAIGMSRISGTSSSIAESLVALHLSNGAVIRCTPEHPLLTNVGWRNAIDILPNTELISTHEAMSVVWQGYPKEKSSKVLLANMPAGVVEEAVRGVRSELCANREENEILFQELWGEVEMETTGNLLEIHGQSQKEGPQPGSLLTRPRVVRVKILKREHPNQYHNGSGGYYVHNIEVAGHPSYSVNGLLVHNCGIKQKNVILVADEAQFMGPSFLSAFANLNKNEVFKAIVLGNPVDLLDPLGKAAEPKDGWSSYMDPQKTVTWDTRFMNGRCVNLIGTDSPNFDFPENQPARYKYLISREKIAATLSFWPQDSIEYYSQCVGTMRVGVMARRVLSRDLCRQFNASDKLLWDGPVTKIGGLDAAYGGDRAMCGHVEFGRCTDGKVRLLVSDPVIVPVVVTNKDPMDAEMQIARYVKKYCEDMGVSPENFFHDSTGRGSLGTALAREWSSLCVPVEFGGSPSKRPVTADTFIKDPQTGVKRLKLADEHYRKFVTELWFAVRYTVEADQMRGMPEEIIDEFCMREWRRVAGDRIELEAKAEMKERTGRSPDLADWLSICLEGSRRHGFIISRLGRDQRPSDSTQWLTDMASQRDDWHKSKRLIHN